jgi:hypothetical protein
VALKPENPVVGGTVLRRAAIASPNYVAGVSGWTINQDGSAEFNNLTIRGVFAGTNFEINSLGAFFYSGTPAAGNLVESITSAAGTDGFTNEFLAGHSSYGPGYATSAQAGQVAFYTGSLAVGWTFQGGIQVTGAGLLVLTATSALFSDNLEIGSNLTVDGTLTVGGSTDTGVPTNNSTSTNGLTSGVINGTSGGASAGTAHTHGPGSYAVANGQHAHNMNNHLHPL